GPRKNLRAVRPQDFYAILQRYRVGWANLETGDIETGPDRGAGTISRNFKTGAILLRSQKSEVLQGQSGDWANGGAANLKGILGFCRRFRQHVLHRYTCCVDSGSDIRRKQERGAPFGNPFLVLGGDVVPDRSSLRRRQRDILVVNNFDRIIQRYLTGFGIRVPTDLETGHCKFEMQVIAGQKLVIAGHERAVFHPLYAGVHDLQLRLTRLGRRGKKNRRDRERERRERIPSDTRQWAWHVELLILLYHGRGLPMREFGTCSGFGRRIVS